MSSIIEGYNYDIFISYRQKDNKGDRWVSEFVEALKTELESTFKEEISVYFDINPHDGLLETHDVDESLKEKLKCLVFIPIISRTYCDPKSFAWEHEFKAFVEMVSLDQFGLKIKLPNGNVTSRILPIKIHDLDPEDKTLLENELGGVLRSIEFIYKSPGVNRPLRTNEDHPQDNLNKTYYRDQINKAANAVKEIISSLKKAGLPDENIAKEIVSAKHASRKLLNKSTVSAFFIILILAVAGYLFIPKLFKSKEQVESSIAVLPFKLLSDEPDKQYLADGMMEAILLHLSKISDLRVPGSTSVEQYRQTSKTIQAIGKELNVEYVLEGNFQKYGDNARLIVQLIRTRKESHIWSNEYNRNWNDILTVQSEVAKAIAGELNTVITPEEKMIIEAKPTSDPTAYDFYLKGNDYARRSFMEKDFIYARQMYEKAVEIDPDFSLAWVGLAASSRNLFNFYYDRSEENLSMTKKYLDKALALSPDLKEVRFEEAGYYYYCHHDYLKSLQILEKLSSEYPNDDGIYARIAYVYRRMGEFSKSLENNEKAISLNPAEWNYWFNAAWTLEVLREYTDAEKYYKRAIDLNPSYSSIYSKLFYHYIRTGQLQKAGEFLITHEKFIDSQAFKDTQAQLEILKRNYVRAAQLIQSLPGHLIGTTSFETKQQVLGFIYLLIPDNEQAVANFKAARDTLLDKISEYGDDHRLYSSLGIVCAGLGMKEEALEAGRKALEILDFSKDAYDGYYPELEMVRILVVVEEYDEAMIRLDEIIKRHGYLTVETLKLDPFWDPVRNNEKFKEIISNPEYQVKISGYETERD